jgi:uncharacterized protein YaiI (UPF0178 family)
MRIWVDADSCHAAVRKIILKASRRLDILVHFVANVRIDVPLSDKVRVTKVAKTENAADDYIAENISDDDIAVTADVPLASRLLPLGVVVINPRGSLFTIENIGEQLSMRNFSTRLRQLGIDTRDPVQRKRNAVKEFAEIFDREVTRAMKKK